MSRSVIVAIAARIAGGRRGHERRVVVLADREDVESHVIGTLGDAHDVRDALVLALRDAGRGVGGGDVSDGEDSELHGVRLSEVTMRRTT